LHVAKSNDQSHVPNLKAKEKRQFPPRACRHCMHLFIIWRLLLLR
jgi:hypothetical protein